MSTTDGTARGSSTRGGAHRAFVDAVTRQITAPPGAHAAASPEREATVRAALARLLDAAAAGIGTPSFAAAASALHADAALLSSVFQNLDLFGVDDPTGRTVALLVGDALSMRDG